MGRKSRKAQRKAVPMMVESLHHFLTVDPIMACSPYCGKLTVDGYKVMSLELLFSSYEKFSTTIYHPSPAVMEHNKPPPHLFGRLLICRFITLRPNKKAPARTFWLKPHTGALKDALFFACALNFEFGLSKQQTLVPSALPSHQLGATSACHYIIVSLFSSTPA